MQILKMVNNGCWNNDGRVSEMNELLASLEDGRV